MIRLLLATFLLMTTAFGLAQYNRAWGTYYGGTRRDELLAITVAGEDAVYAAGWTQSDGAGVISSTGAHQVNRGSASTGSSGRDGMLIKFNGAGVRQWATYYGGNQEDQVQAIATDAQGNVYIAGRTLSGSGIATVGSHKSSTFSTDAFLVKFNSNGVRQWGTYYGSQFQPEEGIAVAIDGSGNVYLAGIATGSTEGVATSGAHQTSIGAQTDAFLVKFNANGVRQWGTFYGGVGNDFATGITTDHQGNAIMSGYTNSSSGIATLGSHQAALGSALNDGFIVKFNGDGVRQWGTYYGGAEIDFVYTVRCDMQNNIYAAGTTQSLSAIATPGSHQASKAGTNLDGDAFLLKLDANGSRLWATYYGGASSDGAVAVAVSQSGQVAIAGGSNSGAAIATTGAFQTTVGGNGLATDGYLAVFDSSGTRQYGTYYGGGFDDNSTAIGFSQASDIVMAGRTLSTGSALSTADAHQTSFNGDDNSASNAWYDGYVVKFGAASSGPTSYTFSGNGNWSNAANWQGGVVPPATIPAGVSIIISPINTDECVIDIPITFAPGSSLQVANGKRLRIPAGLSIQ